jgi:thymidylate kinase
MAKQRALTIAFVGIDGSGKSTLAGNLAARCGAKLVKIRTGRSGLERAAVEAGFADLGAFTGWTEALLMMGALAWQSMKDIKPLRREASTVVLLDRSPLCVLALATVYAPDAVPRLRLLFQDITPPDAVLFVRASPRIAVERLTKRGGSEKTLEFLSSFDRAYAGLPEAARFLTIDGDRTEAGMLAETCMKLALQFPKKANLFKV